MRKKKSSPFWTKGDALFLTAVLAVGLSASWALLRAFDTVSAGRGTQDIGTIVFKQKVAERKSSSQTVWGRVNNKAPVYNFDTVRTGIGASAVVTLNDGTEIHLDEDTMVGLELRQKEFSVALVRGKMAAKRVTITPKTFSVTAKGVEITMENGAVTVANTEAGISLQTDSRVQVASAGQVSAVEAAQAALVRDGQLPEVRNTTSTLLEPADQAYVVGSTPLQSVDFRWKTANSTSTLQITNKDFSSPLKKADSDRGQAKLDLAEGTYLWRVVAGGVASEPRRLVIYKGTVPVSSEPRGVHDVGSGESLVLFAWSKTADADSYRLEVFAAGNTKPLRSATTTLTSLSVPLPPGQYQWRAVGLYPFAQAELAGQSVGFELRKLDKLTAPAPSVGPTSEGKAQFSALASDSVLGWQSVSSAERYEVVIATDPEFKQVVSKTETTANFLKQPGGLIPGDYYWRVRALTKDLASDASSTQEFVVAASLPLVGLSPRSVVAGPLALAWNDPNHGRSYKVEVSPSRDFSEITASIDAASTASGESRSAALAWSRPGSFFWRVSLVNASGSVLAASSPLGFVVAGGLPVPVLTAPAPVVDINEVPALAFRWKPVPGADQYRLTLSRTLAGRPQEIFRGETAETSLALDKWELLTLGTYTWKLVALSKDTQQSLDSRAEFALTQARPPKAVVLRVPKVIYLSGSP